MEAIGTNFDQTGQEIFWRSQAERVGRLPVRI